MLFLRPAQSHRAGAIRSRPLLPALLLPPAWHPPLPPSPLLPPPPRPQPPLSFVGSIMRAGQQGRGGEGRRPQPLPMHGYPGCAACLCACVVRRLGPRPRVLALLLSVWLRCQQSLPVGVGGQGWRRLPRRFGGRESQSVSVCATPKCSHHAERCRLRTEVNEGCSLNLYHSPPAHSHLH